MNTDARRKASANHHAKLKAAGLRKVTVWLTPEGIERLYYLKVSFGSNDAVVELALKRLREG